jgi:hypothetical protein
MDELRKLLERIADSINAAQAHYQIWFTLRGQGKALPEYYDDMDDYRYVDFFHASNAGHYKLMFIELGCLFDTDTRAASMRNLKTKLAHAGLDELVSKIDITLKDYRQLVSNILTIRSTLIAHKEIDALSDEVHTKNGIIPNEVGKLIGVCCSLVNELNEKLFHDQQPLTGETDRFERATFELLEVLKVGRS